MPDMKVLIVLVAVGALALAGCQANGSKEAGGLVLGAAAGGLLGSQVGSGRGQLVGTALGTLAGAGLGAEIGRSLDNADRAMARWNEESAPQPRRSRDMTRRSNLDGEDAGWNGGQSVEAARCRKVRNLATAEAEPDGAHRSQCGHSTGSWDAIN